MVSKNVRNDKGFTLVEVLAVVVILGIIAGIGIPMVTRYIEKTRKQSYETMESSIYDGARNYVMDENIYLGKCTDGYEDIETGMDNLLVDYQYVDKLVDPASSGANCTYDVYGCMDEDATASRLSTYKYKIELNCSGYKKCKIYKDDGTIEDC